METTTAILIARHRLTETSLIVHWCSAECGLFKTVAKGALRPKSPFAGRLDLFVTCEVTFVKSRQGDLHTLKEVHLTAARLPLRASYLSLLVASYFTELIEMVAEKETPLPEIYELLKLALDHLTSHEATANLITRFENRLCAVLGLGEQNQGGAAVLHDVFHRQMPHERKLIFEELARRKT
jgi:DNA repair protein RecO (recombination protein O)